MMPENAGSSGNRRRDYRTREEWHTACEHRGRFCHYCASRSISGYPDRPNRYPPVCKKCQGVILALWVAEEDLGLCNCEVVVEWALRLFHSGERLPAPLQQQPVHSGNTPGQAIFTEVTAHPSYGSGSSPLSTTLS